MQRSMLLLAALLATSASAAPPVEVVCTYAPSQSYKVAAVSGAAGGAAATAGAVAAATGLTVVTHSSGALILTGSSGYIAGTLGSTAAATVAAAPVVVGVALLVGGAAVTLELVCARKNHPDQVKRINDAADEFSTRFAGAMKQVRIAGEDVKKSVTPATEKAVVTIKQGTAEAWDYAYRKSVEVGQYISK